MSPHPQDDALWGLNGPVQNFQAGRGVPSKLRWPRGASEGPRGLETGERSEVERSVPWVLVLRKKLSRPCLVGESTGPPPTKAREDCTRPHRDVTVAEGRESRARETEQGSGELKPEVFRQRPRSVLGSPAVGRRAVSMVESEGTGAVPSFSESRFTRLSSGLNCCPLLQLDL